MAAPRGPARLQAAAPLEPEDGQEPTGAALVAPAVLTAPSHPPPGGAGHRPRTVGVPDLTSLVGGDRRPARPRRDRLEGAQAFPADSSRAARARPRPRLRSACVRRDTKIEHAI
ncbi:hypothetical protein GCM10023082_56940 [Streptomyces tremellae]|uniref:Uncharacterized protein n=1 Tax=Streptomyces tremellae TaxID=1124239 RepID=A0ABP7G1T0_9ACTN